MKSLVKFIKESIESIEDVLEKLAGNTKPAIWDDTMSFKLLDEIDEYQDVHGEWDDSVREAGKIIDGKAVLGWYSEKDAEDLMNTLPADIKKTIGKKGKEIYKKGTSIVKLWETKIFGHDASIVTFRTVRNDSGEEYPQYWCCVGLE